MRTLHKCPAMEKLPRDWSGNRLIYAHGDKFTDGMDFNVSINTTGMNDIFVERWFKLKNGGITCERESLRMNYCPLCGAKLDNSLFEECKKISVIRVGH